MKKFVYAALALMLLIAPSSTWAQGTTGSISGTVVDESKGVMPGVTILVKNLENGLSGPRSPTTRDATGS